MKGKWKMKRVKCQHSVWTFFSNLLGEKKGILEAFAENMPFENELFDFVHESLSLHAMQPGESQKTIGEIYRVLRTGGIFTLVDSYQPANPMFIKVLWLFL